MLLDAEHAAWLREHWTGGKTRKDLLGLAGGLRKQFKISHNEATEIVKVFLADPDQTGTDDQDIITILKEETEARRTRMARAKYIWISFTCFFVLMGILMIVFHGDFNNFSGFYGFFGIAGAAAAASGRHKMAARAAAKLSDKRTAPSLMELLDTQDKDVRGLVELGLTNVLPLLDENDFATLTEEQLAHVLRSLGKTQNMNYAVATMGMLRRFGGVNAIHTLESIAEGRSALRKKDGARAQSLASMTLADIRMRAAKKKIDERVQELGGSLTEYTTRVLGEDPATIELNQQT